MSERRPTTQQKRIVMERARGFCEYCRSSVHFSPDPFSVEHIKPFSRGGKTTLGNLAFSCQGCNYHKYTHTEGYDPMAEKNTPLFHPRKQKWSDHFTWSEDFTLILGITPTGRATIETLQLNREGCTNLRRVLYAFDEHPPKDD